MGKTLCISFAREKRGVLDGICAVHMGGVGQGNSRDRR